MNAAVPATAELSAPRPEFVGPSPAGRLRSLYGGRGWLTLAVLLVVTAVILPSLYLVLPADHPFHVSAFWIALVGKIMCYAMLAVALDLVWGYTGILSLGHGLFFALGGYAIGMYLMRSIGRDGVYQSDLPDFMVFLDWKEYPWYWAGTEHFFYAAALVVLVPGVLAFVFGFFAFRSRIKGVYFSIITQALTFAFMLLFFRNNTGFGGNNGFTDFKRLLGFTITSPETRAALFVITALALAATLLCLPLHRHLEARAGPDRDPRFGVAARVLRLQHALVQALRLDLLGGARRASQARSTCRRWGSSTRARCRRRTRSRRRSGSRSAAAAPWWARSPARFSSTARRAGSRSHSPSTGCSSSARSSSW